MYRVDKPNFNKRNIENSDFEKQTDVPLDLLGAIEQSREFAPKARREFLRPFLTRPNLSSLALKLKSQKDRRIIVRALCDIAAMPDFATLISHFAVLNRADFSALLTDEDAKVRKNGAELLGRVAPTEFALELCRALLSEQTEFVKPSIILALGNAKTPEATEILQNYTVTGEGKHAEEARVALMKAAPKGKTEKRNKLGAIPNGFTVLLDCPNARITAGEAQSAGHSVLTAKGVFTTLEKIADFDSIYNLRTFYDAGILLGEFSSLDSAVASLKNKTAKNALYQVFGQGSSFRTEVRGEADRKAVAKAAMLILDGSFINDPSDYDFEIRFCTDRNVTLAAFPAKRFDTRFSGYSGRISASIHPAAAASALYFAKNYLKPDADVIDPFCGSGTMLFERNKFGAKSLTGTDIMNDALKSARENERNIKSGARFLIKNATTPFEQTYDEVISNMPFGIRVSNHADNERLYEKFMTNLKTLLKPDGAAILFTHEKSLLEREAKFGFEISAKAKLACGGLFPNVYVIKKL